MAAVPPELATILSPELMALLQRGDLRVPHPVSGRRQGVHRSKRAGAGLDFRDHRPYVPGDDPRRLDWRAAARRDRLVLRQTEAEEELAVVIAIDASGGMAYGDPDEALDARGRGTSKWVHAAAFVGTLAAITIAQADRLGFVIARDGELEGDSARPTGHRDRLRELGHGLSMEPGGTAPVGEALDRLARTLPSRALVIAVSDFLDPEPGRNPEDRRADEALMQQLGVMTARGHTAAMVQVLHRDELTFPWSDRRLIQLEDLRDRRRPVEGAAAAMREGYLERLDAHLTGLEESAERAGVHLVRTVTDEPVANCLRQLLARIAGRPAPAEAPGRARASP